MERERESVCVCVGGKVCDYVCVCAPFDLILVGWGGVVCLIGLLAAIAPHKVLTRGGQKI